MDVAKDRETLLFLAVGNIPTGGLGHEPDKRDLDQTGGSLNNGGNTPCPVVADVIGAVGKPSGNDGTRVPGRVIDGGEDGTVLWVDQLGDEQGGGSVGNGNTETDQESSTQEHVVVGTDRLQDDTNQHEDTSHENTHATTEDICGVGHEWDGRDGTSSHDGIQYTESTL